MINILKFLNGSKYRSGEVKYTVTPTDHGLEIEIEAEDFNVRLQFGEVGLAELNRAIFRAEKLRETSSFILEGKK